MGSTRGSPALKVTVPSNGKARVTSSPTDPAAATECGFEDRDAHLRGADWFDLERHPDIAFRSTRLCDAYSSRWLAFGKLTMRGVTMPIEVEAS